MESLIPELALFGSKNEFTRTTTVLLLLSEVGTGAVSLVCIVVKLLRVFECAVGRKAQAPNRKMKPLTRLAEGVRAHEGE